MRYSVEEPGVGNACVCMVCNGSAWVRGWAASGTCCCKLGSQVRSGSVRVG